MGNTLGNYLQKLKVVSIQESKKDINFGQALKRHLVDMLDVWFFLGIILFKNTKYNQRLGDLWAKTIVIDKTDPKQGIV